MGEYCRMPDVIVLAIDTCDSRGSVAVLRDATVLKVLAHESEEDYSSWLLPAVGECLEACAETARGERISWVSTDAECVFSEGAWKAREMRGERVESVSSVRAPMIGRLGLAALAQGRFTDALALDANYVRRSDAEIFWKGKATHGR